MTDTTIDCLRPADRGIQCKRQQGDRLNHRAMPDPIVRALGRCRANPSEASANYNRMDGSGWHGAQDYRRERLLARFGSGGRAGRSEEHTSELQSLMRISYAVFCLKKKKHETVRSRCQIETYI